MKPKENKQTTAGERIADELEKYWPAYDARNAIIKKFRNGGYDGQIFETCQANNKTPLANDLLIEMERLEKEATPPGWTLELDDASTSASLARDVWRIIPFESLDERRKQGTTMRPRYAATVYSEKNARFIARARNVMPYLLQEIRASREEIARLTKELDEQSAFARIIDRHGPSLERLAAVEAREIAKEATEDAVELRKAVDMLRADNDKLKKTLIDVGVSLAKIDLL